MSTIRKGVALTGALSLLIAAGCTPANDATTETKLRAAYQKKGFNINDVPPSQRAIVEGYMKAGQKDQVPNASVVPAKK